MFSQETRGMSHCQIVHLKIRSRHLRLLLLPVERKKIIMLSCDQSPTKGLLTLLLQCVLSSLYLKVSYRYQIIIDIPLSDTLSQTIWLPLNKSSLTCLQKYTWWKEKMILCFNNTTRDLQYTYPILLLLMFFDAFPSLFF